MAEAADRAHSIELAGLFLEPPDQQHVAQRAQFLFPGESNGWCEPSAFSWPDSLATLFLGCGHGNSG